MNPLLFAFIKILFAAGAVLLAAYFKYIREETKLKIIKESILYHIRIFPNTRRRLYDIGTDQFMNQYHPSSVSFITEVVVNSFRGMGLLSIYQLGFYYEFLPYRIYFGAIVVAWVMTEVGIEILKGKKWFIMSVLIIWISLFIMIFVSQSKENNREEHAFRLSQKLTDAQKD